MKSDQESGKVEGQFVPISLSSYRKRMNTVNKTSRTLGLAFLLQFVTSFTSSAILKQAWFVPGNIRETMLKIADNPWLMRTTILLDMFTALGIIFLAGLYPSVKMKPRVFPEKMALSNCFLHIQDSRSQAPISFNRSCGAQNA